MIFMQAHGWGNPQKHLPTAPSPQMMLLMMVNTMRFAARLTDQHGQLQASLPPVVSLSSEAADLSAPNLGKTSDPRHQLGQDGSIDQPETRNHPEPTVPCWSVSIQISLNSHFSYYFRRKIQELPRIPELVEGKFWRSPPYFWWKKQWFPVECPWNQSIERSVANCCPTSRAPWGIMAGKRAVDQDGAQQACPLKNERFKSDGFHKWGLPKNEWLVMEHPLKMHDLGGPPFLEITKYRKWLDPCPAWSWRIASSRYGGFVGWVERKMWEQWKHHCVRSQRSCFPNNPERMFVKSMNII